ncbi:Glutamine-binding periplasmic protein precursor [Kingella negevensis]|uniref:Glutamine-binding periplasmic protein n=1 Tax=Kingella negevensis TaxID=1522312 RepID=A0A238HH23_9NEIS|nr:Glutamine-binding periplasmic protein precursor [Kingella negevensis]
MNTNKWLAVSFATLALAACGNQSSSQNAASGTNTPKVLKVVTNPQFAPFDSLNEKQEVQGFDVDLMYTLADAGNFKIEYSTKPWDSLFTALSTDDADIVAGTVTITEDRKKTMDFSDPYYQVRKWFWFHQIKPSLRWTN